MPINHVENIKKSPEVIKVDEIIEYEEILLAISEDLIRYREKHHLTQKELASILGYNQTMISKLEKGDYNPTFKVIYNISRKLTKSSKLFIDILKNIINNIDNLGLNEYKVKLNPKKQIEKKYDFCSNKNEKIITFKYYNKNNNGGYVVYEGNKSSIADAG